ncbi:TetR/AcrR family transcriptional regulator [Nonomuraea longicatena]|uniref:TetR/AcrR family transcriptional regulator n=1 Tax=Nonomuraea longicatena TaxID=83682 RepID=A0ABN1P7K3_9ACTN
MSTTQSRREQYSQATKAALLDAATRRFAAHGFAKTSLEDVAADIHASRGAVYHHYPSKAALFEAVVERLEAETMGRIAEQTSPAADAWEASMVALDVFLDRCCDPVYGRVVWIEAPLALGWRRWNDLQVKYGHGVVANLFEGLIAAGRLKPMPVEPMANLVFHLLCGAGQALAESSEPERPRVLAEYKQAINLLLDSLVD